MMFTGIRRTLASIGRESVRIVLPSRCVACEDELPLRERVASCCSSCWQKLARITTSSCRYCAFPSELPRDVAFTCLECSASRPHVDSFAAWGHYRGALEKVLIAFKFRRHDYLASHLASLVREVSESSCDVIVPVPLHPKRLRSRGYNQAELLTLELSKALEITHAPGLLARTRETQPQTSLGRDERARNVRKAFVASREVAGARLLLVDDVCTTGATVRECARVLRRAGAAEVHAAVVARA